jgi:HEAT repeats
MFEDEHEMTFEAALSRLFATGKIPDSLLYRLSDMTADELLEFDRQWNAAGVRRREEIVQRLVDLSREDFIVDFQPVFTRCMSDDEPALRVAGLQGLWDSTDLSLIEPIIDLLQNDSAPAVRAAAAGALAHYLLISEWGQLSGVPTGKIADALLAAYNDPQSESIVRRACLETLGCVPSPEISVLIENAYDSYDRELQASALYAMGNSADERWLRIVLDEMENPIEEIRLEAVRAAGNIGHADAIPRLAELAYDENLEIARAAIFALGETGGDTAEAVLIAMIEDAELESLAEEIEEALEESAWSLLDLQPDFFADGFLDEEE